MTIIEQLILAYFATAVFYTLILTIAGFFKKNIKYSIENENYIAVMVPAYKEDDVILHVSQSHLKLNYPSNKFDVIVIADQLKADTINKMRGQGIKVIEVFFEESTKSKSLNAAFEQLEDKYEIALICDADNILEKDFLHKINSTYNNGHRVIQARRVAKNLNTSYAILDGASEIINNHLFRKAYNVLGLSSSLIGSGMAFNYKYIKDLFLSISAVGGFDKILQLKIIESGEQIFFHSNALVFDEKIESSQAFEKQRRRWLHSQFSYPRKYFIPALKQLSKGNFDYFNLAAIYFIFPTRMLLLGLLGTLAVLSYFFNSYLTIDTTYWWILFISYGICLALCLPRKFYNKKLFQAVLNLPIIFLKTLLLLFKLKGANKSFIHTSHSNPEVTNNFFNSDEAKP